MMHAHVQRGLTRSMPALLLVCTLAACANERPDTGPAIVRRGDDVLASGDEVPFADSVTGDLMAAAGDIRFTGATGGDYLAAAGNQIIGGRIHGDVRAAAGNVEVTAHVDRNATIAGGNVEIDPGALLGRNAYLTGGSVRVTGQIRGSLQSTAGEVMVNAPIGGDVAITAGELRVGPNAVIAGDLRYRVPPNNVAIDPGARIGGEVIALPARDFGGVWLMIRLVWALGFLVAGAVLVALFPGVAASGALAMRERAGMSAAAGAAWLIGVPIAAALLAVTLVGIPLAVIAIFAWLVLAYLGRAVLSVWIGRQVLGQRAREGRWGTLLGFVAGAILLVLAGFVPIIGPVIMLAATIVGAGALIVGVRDWSDGRRDVPAVETA